MKPGPWTWRKWTGTEHSDWMEGGYSCKATRSSRVPWHAKTSFMVRQQRQGLHHDAFNSMGEAEHAKGTSMAIPGAGPAKRRWAPNHEAATP